MATKILDILVDIATSGIKSLDKAGKSFDDFDKKTTKSNDSLKAFADSSNKFAGKITPAVVGLTAFTAGMAAITKTALNAGDAIAKTADKVGFTTDSYQELTLAASLTGIAQSNLDSGLQRFSRGVAEAAKGTGTLYKNLESLGISVTDSSGKLRSNDAILNDYADAIMNAGSEQEQLRLATDAFGRSGADLVLTMKNGSAGLDEFRAKARELGLVIDDNLLRGAESANDAIDMLSRSLKASFQKILLELAPTIQTIAELLISLTPIVQSVLSALGPFLPAIVAIIGALSSLGIVFLTIINPLIQFGALILPLIGTLSGIIPIILTIIAVLGALWALFANAETIISVVQETFEAFFAGLQYYFDAFVEAMQGLYDGIASLMAGIVETFMSAIESIGSFIQEWIDFFNYLWESIKSTLDQIKEYVIGVVNSIVETIRNMWSAITGAQAQASAQAPQAQGTAMKTGGLLGGYGGGDRIRALLEAGEFVVRKEAVKKFGVGFMASINNLKMPDMTMRFQDGGLVPAGAQTNNFTFNAPITNNGGDTQTTEAFRKIIIPELKKAMQNNSMGIATLMKKFK